MDDSMNKIMAQLQFGIANIETQMKTVEALANATALRVQETFAKTQLTSGGANTQAMTAQQAMINRITQEGEASKAAIVAQGEAKITKTMADAALARQRIVTEEAKTELLTVEQSLAKQKLAYMKAREQVFSERPNLILRHMSWLLTGAVLFEGYDLLKEGLVGVEKGMKGLQTVLPEIAHDQEAYNEASRDAIDIMQKYGAAVDEVMQSSRSFGRMYKDVETVMGLVNNATLLNVIDNVKLEDAVKGNEAALSIYGKELQSTNEILAFSGKLMDSLTRLSHESMAQASDLVQILQQSAGAAKNAKVEMDRLLGLGSASVRATGLQGQGGNLGRMLRTVFTQLSAPTQAVEKDIEDIGVKMRESNGELRNAYDIILDLSLATKDASISQEELNQAINRAASGKFQYSKLSALVGSFDEIVQNTARSINAQGMTMQMAAQQMDTIERKAKMLRATWIDMFSEAGDSGLRDSIKELIDNFNQFSMGLKELSPEVFNFGFKLLGVVIAYKAITAVSNALLPVTATATLVTRGLTLAQAQQAITTHGASTALAMETGALVATTTATEGATVATKAFTLALIKNPIGLVVTALSTLAGVALIKYTSKLGEAEKAQMDLNQAQQDEVTIAQQQIMQHEQEESFLESMKQKHQQLTEKINSGKLGTQELADAKKDLKAVEDAILIVVDEETRAKIIANGVTQDEIDLTIESARKSKEAELAKIEHQKELTDITIKETLKRIKALETENALWAEAGAKTVDYMSKHGVSSPAESLGIKGLKSVGPGNAELDLLKKKFADNQQKSNELAASIMRAKSALGALDEGSDDTGDGGSGGSGSGSGSSSDWLSAFLDQTLALAEAQARLNDATQRSIDILGARRTLLVDNAMTMSEYINGLNEQNGAEALLEKHQAGLHAEADAYRAAITALEAKQKTLNTSTEEGQEAYSKIGDEIDNARQKVDELGQSWLSDEAAQRSIPTEKFQEMSEWVDKLVNMGAINLEQQMAIYEAVDETKLTYAEQVNLMEKQVDLGKQLLKQAVDKKIAEIEAENDAFKKASDAKIDAMQTELDLMDEQTEQLEEQQRIQESQTDMAKARQNLADAQSKLSNVQNEKNTRIFQNGTWDYIADPQAVKDAQDEVEDAQDALIDAQNSFNDTMMAIQEAQYRKELEAQIQHEKDLQADKDKAADEAKKKLQDDWDAYINGTIPEKGAETNTALAKVLDDLNLTAESKLAIMAGKVSNYVAQMKRDLLSIGEATGVDVTGIVGSFDSGGAIPATGLAMVHAGEYMLNNDNVRALGGISGVRNLLASLSFPKAISANSIVRSSNVTSKVTNDYGVKIDNVNLPQVVDASGLIRNLKQMAG